MLAIMRSFVTILALLVCGCASTRQPVSSHQTILDDVLSKPKYAEAIRQAERDLPNDQWVDFKGQRNRSRSAREYDVAAKMLADIKPKLQAMSVSELVRSFKVVPYPAGILTNNFSGVRGDVYVFGNLMITKEIKSRPKSELEVLSRFADEKVAIWTGDEGSVTTLASFVQYDVFDK